MVLFLFIRKIMELNWITVAHLSLIEISISVIFINGINGQMKLKTNDIVILNKPIDAIFGRATVINPLRDLKLHVRPGDTCTATVVEHDRGYTYSPGRLSSSKFSCNFGSEGLKYIHFGGNGASNDLVQILLKYDSATQTLIIPLSLVVNFIFIPLEIITQNNAITVDRHMGLSSPIDSSTIQFNFPQTEFSRCKISMLGQYGLPQYGYLTNNSFSLTNIDCERFLTMGMQYKHHAQLNTPNRDFIPMTVQIFSENGELQKQEYFRLTVYILSGQENSPPEPSRNALFVMNSINQFVMTAITPEIMSAFDDQTSFNFLLFNITQPLGPGEGDIVNTDNIDSPVQFFFQHEINHLKIAYKPTSSDSNIKRLFQLEVTILDTEGLSSDPIPLMIVVEPMNTNAPVVTRNTGIQLVEGQSKRITSPDVLEITDLDNLKDVKIYHIAGLKHGHLVFPVGKKYFTPTDLKLGNVVYHHDDSESYSDNIIFKISDGTHEVEFLFPVTIYPKDDIAPALIVNTGVELHENDTVEISQYVLSAGDIDTDKASVTFNLEIPYSKLGIITKRQFEIPEDKENWIFENGVYDKVVNTFTQMDLIEGKIFYKHVGNHITDTITNKIQFSISDNGTPPNKSPVYNLNVKIHPADNIPPYLHPNTDLRMEVEGFQLQHFRKKDLRYTDDDTNDREITYVITREPYDTFKDGPKAAGKIVYCDNPHRSIFRFLQSEINTHKICFQPPSIELSLTSRIIQFDFQVEDLAGNILPDQRFTIILKSVDNQPPVVTNAGATVPENDQIVITSQMIDIEDKDTDLTRVIIIVKATPNYGDLIKDSEILNAGDLFTRNDIVQEHISYRNQGQNIEAKEDRILFEITDGVHFVPITFRIKIQQKDDEQSYFRTDENITLISGILNFKYELFENQTVLVRPEQFRIRNPNSNIMNIMYVINQYPEHGIILKDGRPASYFSQREIWLGKITYEHRKKEIGMTEVTDQVKLGIHDNANIVLQDGTSLKDINVYFKIKPVNNIPPRIIVSENVNVKESDMTPILKTHLDVRDLDSNEDDILCMITEQPKHGFLTNTAPYKRSENPMKRMQPVSAFTIGNVRQGDILYVQSVHKGVEPRTDNFVIFCSDGINLSNRETVRITIQPLNDEEPEVHVREFIGSEGMEIRIDLPVLHVVDKDEPSDVLTLIITKYPSHGKIVKQTRAGDTLVNNFTQGDIELSTVNYKHDGSETQSDSFEFTLTDGKHNVSKSIPIIIFSVDDEPPRLSINNGIKIENLGDRKVISNKDLLAEDIDSSVENITYIIKVLPQQGYLTKLERNFERNLTLGSYFTQNDINNLLVTYVHTGKEATRDLIKFDVTDGLNPLTDRCFYVTIKGMDIIYPEVINHGVPLPERGWVFLTTNITNITDMNSKYENIKFIITSTAKHGYVDLIDQSGLPTDTFTQLDLASNRVRYVHNGERGIKMDYFEFAVASGLHSVYRTFKITMIDVDNKIPVLMYSVLRLKEGKNKIITPLELRAVDLDTPDENIIFTITQVPLHGNLLYNLSKIVSRFSLKDLSQKLICYQHDGTETLSDSFTFTVTDGTNFHYFIPGSNVPTRQPQEMDIDIIPIDSGVPHIVINTGASFLAPLDIGIGFEFTSRHLHCGDHDSPANRLHYVITVHPQHGYIRNIRRGNGAVATWTQGDIDRQVIQYVLNPGENATSDTFFFQVTDKGGNTLENQPFHLNWCWITFKQSRVTVSEKQEVLDVVLNRRGYLAETSFVTINVTERTAAIGKDVSRQFAEQVQFNPGQTEKVWHLPIRDDSIYEKEETLELRLTDTVSAILEQPDVALVTIVDPEDESTVFFPEVIYLVDEKATHLEVPVHRTGDLSQQLKVICYTKQDTAKGTSPNQVLSYSDYITRLEDLNNIIHFDKGEANKTCSVTIIDDSLFEEEERFSLVLSQPMGGKLGTNKEIKIVIGQDPADEPRFYFDQLNYHVDESAGVVEIKVWKTGTDLSRPSSITVKSRQIEPSSAEAGVDYVPVVRILDFAPGEMTKTLTVTILDDLGHQVIEGAEKFELHLREPVGGSMGEPSVTTVTINDSVSDLPIMEFAAVEYEVLESEEQVVAMVTRSGDLNGESYVRCYTKQSSALKDKDFNDRPDSNASFVIFKPDEREAECQVKIINDHQHEGAESFRLVLGTPGDSRSGVATLGGQVTTKITILDPEDSPVIKFDKSQYTVNEPIIPGDVNILKVAVIRLGDTSQTSEVRVSTKGGSASAGRDFNDYSRLLRFEPGVSQLFAEIEINYDAEREDSESFSIHLSQDSLFNSEVVHNSRATVYIEEKSKFVDVTFPVPPLVVSLRDYDRVEQSVNLKLINGYPLVCVSPCSSKHPKYNTVQQLCSGVDDSLTKFRWRVGPPNDESGVTENLRDLETNTVFTTARSIALDSIYFTRGSNVQCYARAVNQDGEPGMEIGSQVVTVDPGTGLCPPRTAGTVGAEPFSARLRYTGPDDDNHPNTVCLTIQIPHTDGMFPVISTRHVSNFWVALSKDGYRLEHQCSNLLDVEELRTKSGFITNSTTKMEFAGESEHHEFNSQLRPDSTLRFYRNLDLDSCVWTFEANYDMSELVKHCGATVQTSTQMVNMKQPYISLKLPLYVSYVYYSPQPTMHWRHFDQSTNLQLKFVYNTAMLWQKGITATQEVADGDGQMYLNSMRIQDSGNLVVSFQTVANFRGQFVENVIGSSISSSVHLSHHPDIDFTLRLLRSDPTFDQPKQLWEFVANKALQDFSGDYKIQLIPCFATLSQTYQPITCSSGDLMTFDLPIRFQQVSDPVPAEFSLNTEFHLRCKREPTRSKSGIGLTQEDTVFVPGDIICGNIVIDPVQPLGNQFLLNIEKVFICSGKDGYIPKYDPENNEYGCAERTDNLDAAYRIIDISAPETVDQGIDSIPFKARLAREDGNSMGHVSRSGGDSFSFDSKPIFQVDSGKHWFLHAIYSIKPLNKSSVQKQREKAIEKHSLSDISGVGNGERGTNMAPLILDFSGKSLMDESYQSNKIITGEGHTPLLAVLIGGGVLLLIGIFILVIFIRHRRKRTSPPPTPSGTITVMLTSPGQTRVISNAHIFTKNNMSEV